MLQRAIKELRGDDIFARDGTIGSVEDVYFDDARWTVRYLVVDPGTWLPGRKVLISPAAVLPVQTRADGIKVDLTREQIENAPGIDADPPISREMEAAYSRHFGWPNYWVGPYLWGTTTEPLAGHWPVAQPVEPGAATLDGPTAAAEVSQDSHLRSAREVVGYSVQAPDGEVGALEDLLIDDKSWAIADVLIDTTRWLPGGIVRVPPAAIAEIDWEHRQIRVRLTRAELERSHATG